LSFLLVKGHAACFRRWVGEGTVMCDEGKFREGKGREIYNTFLFGVHVPHDFFFVRPEEEVSVSVVCHPSEVGDWIAQVEWWCRV